MSEQDVRDILAHFMDVKRAACSSEGPSDLSPCLIGGFADGMMAGAELSAPREGFVEAVAQIRQAHPGMLVWLAQCGDVLLKYRTDRDAPRHATSLSDAHQAGDMTVVDALSVYLVKVDGEDYAGQVVYRYDDRGQPEFGPLTVKSERGRGFVPDALRAALAASAE